jgi:hypothetical protein
MKYGCWRGALEERHSARRPGRVGVQSVRSHDRARPQPHRLQRSAPALQFHPHRTIPSPEIRN